MNKPKILILDIETAPILASVWGIWEQNVSLNMIKSDWHVLSWAAKWKGDPASKTMYMDQRNAKNIQDDKNILKGIWKLLDECDILITQNGISFDIKKLNARFVLNGMPPPSSFKHVDTKRIASKKFAFTSNKLEYMTGKLCTKYKKLKHNKYPGFELWSECLKGNLDAWKEMEKYNKYDILSLEELYEKLQPWDNAINYNLFTANETSICSCGNNTHKRNGFAFTGTGKFQRYVCNKCGTETRSKVNLFSKEKRDSFRPKVG